jgi:predicted N-acetyltransferase YhbS
MNTNIRPVAPADSEAVGQILYKAFCGIADCHNFRHDFPCAETAVQMAQMVINSPGVYGVVAEENGKIVGSNFLWEQNEIAGVGPITIDPEKQSNGVGRRLMQAVIERGKGAKGIRLVQEAFNTASMSLYASLGFDVKEPLVVMEGEIKDDVPEAVEVRPLVEEDFAACAELCRRVHGFDRNNEIERMFQMFPAFVAVREKRIIAYVFAPSNWQLNHAVAETTEDSRLCSQAREN